jgi:NAD(P)-dependent dehydrogenase (short-subunit alcohol dehydrogenase family)
VRLNGKVAVVSGAAKGIGAAIAGRFTAEGAVVFGGDLDYTEAGSPGKACEPVRSTPRN